MSVDWKREGWSPDLAAAYLGQRDKVGTAVRLEVVTRDLLRLLGRGPKRILDMGGGDGRQATALALAGHMVWFVDPDGGMLELAGEVLRSKGVRDDVVMVESDIASFEAPEEGFFDLVCCHSVLMYIDETSVALELLVRHVAEDGLLSVLTINREALALRSALRGNLKVAREILVGRRTAGCKEVEVGSHSIAEVASMFERCDLFVRSWSGVKIFSDHVDLTTFEVDREYLESLIDLEWAAHDRDPYRRIARLIHVVGSRSALSST